MKHPTAERVFTLTVNANNIIESVSREWLSFARENDASHLTEKAVVGQPLFRYLVGEETKHLYRLIIDRVRKTSRKITIPFRCDGPAVRRFMELEISEDRPGQVRFDGRILREESREPVLLFDVSVDRTEEYLVVCVWCKCISVDGEWLEVELAVAQLNLFEADRLPQMKQGVCPACAQRMEREAGLAD